MAEHTLDVADLQAFSDGNDRARPAGSERIRTDNPTLGSPDYWAAGLLGVLPGTWGSRQGENWSAVQITRILARASISVPPVIMHSTGLLPENNQFLEHGQTIDHPSGRHGADFGKCADLAYSINPR
jgi:hypothetical protein